ncbi:hypothetical protein G7Y89_g1768 [Cudoniella acicularis]|uniref:Sphingoid long-chain base transporter RSB1 n=1 Tax=Cudoniella acicularis TaxID=354080 RepID=A0A8H4RWG8_9HELO|nr:hypothetical protein G7Y89_g1768 [Cudoniella acicularis]
MDSLSTIVMGLFTRASHRDAYADCTVDTCPIDTSFYYYRISLAANAAFIALFSISLIGFLVTYAFTRRATAFTFAMTCGVILEVIGYAGRIQSWQNQWKEDGFLMQIFIPCDLLSLLLQAAGGGLASTASHQGKSPDTGDHIMVAGLAWQVFTLLIFMILCIDFAIRTRRRYKALGEAAFDQNPHFITLRTLGRSKVFLLP